MSDLDDLDDKTVTINGRHVYRAFREAWSESMWLKSIFDPEKAILDSRENIKQAHLRYKDTHGKDAL